MRTADQIEIEVHLPEGGWLAGLAEDVREGLSSPFKEIPPKYFYDERGSELFEAITELPEYYPTRAERAILDHRAGEIVAAAGPTTLIELGSGAAAKTRCLLDAMRDAGSLETYVPVDISEEITRRVADELVDEYEGLRVHGVVSDYETHLERVPREEGALIAFLGGTIGNFRPGPRRSFLARIASLMYPGDRFLLGTDLVKDVAVLEAAYNDSAGVTAEFNKNVLHVLNRELGANFDPDEFEHVAFFDAENEWIDIRLRSLAEQFIDLTELDMRTHFARNEEMRTEISTKFTRERLEQSYADAGLGLVEWWTDPDELYALSLARPALASQTVWPFRLMGRDETKGAIMKVFVAGATGALGKQLVPRLVAAGHEVVGMTRSEERAELVRELGAEPAVADALDPEAVGAAVSDGAARGDRPPADRALGLARPAPLRTRLRADQPAADRGHRHPALRRPRGRDAQVRRPELRRLAGGAHAAAR